MLLSAPHFLHHGFRARHSIRIQCTDSEQRPPITEHMHTNLNTMERLNKLTYTHVALLSRRPHIPNTGNIMFNLKQQNRLLFRTTWSGNETMNFLGRALLQGLVKMTTERKNK